MLSENNITAQNFKDFYEVIRPYLGGGQAAVDCLLEVNQFPVSQSDWISTIEGGYSYKCTISTDKYSDTSAPVWKMVGAGGSSQIPTRTEQLEGEKVKVALFNASGITLYAIKKPLCDLQIFVKGGVELADSSNKILYNWDGTLAIDIEVIIRGTNSTVLEFASTSDDTSFSVSTNSATMEASIVEGSKNWEVHLHNTENTIHDVEVTVSAAKVSSTFVVHCLASFIYGVSWSAGNKTTRAMTRTDDAVSFANPNPWYTEFPGTPSSPFDSIRPWCDMEIVNDPVAGSVVKIPKFYYKWRVSAGSETITGLQIAPDYVEGFNVSPAHMDRGDGVGERPYVYVGRYPCSNVHKSISGGDVTNGYTFNGFKSGIHNLGSTIWMWDFSMLVTIWMLYMVEFANFDSQAVIGVGGTTTKSISRAGATDSMPYHTGSLSKNRTSNGQCQYRHIESLWDNVVSFVDGIRFNSSVAYVTLNPAESSESSGLQVLSGLSTTTSGYYIGIIDFKRSVVSGYDWVMYPSNINRPENSIGDNYAGSTGQTVAYFGGSANVSASNGMGLFYVSANSSRTSTAVAGSRLMILPNTFD